MSRGQPTSSGRSTTRTCGLLLVGKRGWTPEQFEQWFADTASWQLLNHHARSEPGKTH